MLNFDSSKTIVQNALEVLNEELEDSEKIVMSNNTILFGIDAIIDSLQLVSLVVDIETTLNCEHGYDISLTDDRAMTREKSPFNDVNALAEYIAEITKEEK
jgi:acyl carrier protein